MPTPPTPPAFTERTLALRDMLGECIMPRLDLKRFWGEPDYRANAERAVREHTVGGYCLFEGTPDQVSGAIFILQTIALDTHGIPLLFSTDAEFGLPMRFSKGGTEFPDPMAIAHTGDTLYAYEAGQAIAEEMLPLGLSWNFAPVADVNSNRKNPIINTRAFGEDAQTVAEYAKHFMRGLQANGIAACAKHFPGHGDTAVDSHTSLPIINAPRSRFDEVEFVPFRRLIDLGVHSVMLAHIVTPELAKSLGATDAESLLPSSLSRAIVTTLLREEFGFKGVIITDALEMRAIADHYGEAEACLLSLNAGVDILLMPLDPNAAFESLLKKLKTGELSDATVRAAAMRILRLKEIVNPQIPTRDGLQSLKDMALVHQALAQDIAERALVVEGERSVSVLDRSVIIVTDGRDRALQRAGQLSESLERHGGIVKSIGSPEEVLIEDCTKPEGVIIAVFHRARGYVDGRPATGMVEKTLTQIAQTLRNASIRPAALLLFGNPYLDALFEDDVKPQSVVKAFSESAASVKAVVRKVIE